MDELTAQNRPYRERLKFALDLLKLKTGDDRFALRTEARKQAQDVYDERKQLLSDLRARERRLDRALDTELDAKHGEHLALRHSGQDVGRIA